MSDMGFEPASVGGRATGRDPWAGFGSGAPSRPYPDGGGNAAAGPDDAVADLVRRLQGRVDGQEALLERVASLAQRADDRARLVELRDTARRIRRDSEALLLLCDADPQVHRGVSHTAPSVLADAAALVDEPSRVVLRVVPDVTLAASAAVELRHLVAELVDEAADTSPGARIEVGGRTEPDGALVVEVVVAGPGRAEGRRPGARGATRVPRLAERLARRSTGGIRLERPLIDQAEGLVATVLCPAALVTGTRVSDSWELPSVRPPSGGQRSGSFPSPQSSSRPPSRSALSSSLPSPAPPPLPARVSAPAPDTLLVGSARPSSTRAGGDELFGPLPTSVGTVATPIFEAVASAWFRDDQPGSAADWDSPGDREWRAAAAAVAKTEVASTTSTGLPRRSPGERLVPPPRTARRPAAPDERVPERVRDRLATYQRGLQQGRHRATDAGAADPEAGATQGGWSADGW